MSSLESTILVAILVASLGLIGNIIYFQYSVKNNRRREIVKQLLVDLLLPLYITLMSDELELGRWIDNGDLDPYDFEAYKPERLLKSLEDIIKANIYLADDELHSACLSFIKWAYDSDSSERFQRIHEGDLKEDEKFQEFKDIVYKKYEEERSRYLS